LKARKRFLLQQCKTKRDADQKACSECVLSSSSSSSCLEEAQTQQLAMIDEDQDKGASKPEASHVHGSKKATESEHGRVGRSHKGAIPVQGGWKIMQRDLRQRGRKPLKVSQLYRGPNSDVKTAPHNKAGPRGWEGGGSGNWRYYDHTDAKVRTEIDEHTKVDPPGVPYWKNWIWDREHHHSIDKDWYGELTHDKDGNRKLEPSFYYDGVVDGEWHDGWEDYRRDFNEGATPWGGETTRKIWGKEVKTNVDGLQDPQHIGSVGIDDEGWARARRDLTVHYRTDFYPAFDKLHPDYRRLRDGHGKVRYQGELIPPAGERLGHFGDSMLLPGSWLASEDYFSSFIDSVGGEYRLIMQADGNAVVYHMHGAQKLSSSRQAGSKVWESGSARRGTPPYRLYLKGQNVLVIYDKHKSEVWSSGSSGQERENSVKVSGEGKGMGDTFTRGGLKMHQDGALVLRDQFGNEVWRAGIHTSQRHYT